MMSGDQRITIRARSGIEAQHAHNDIFPGDPVSVGLGSLAREAAREAAEGLVRHLDRLILAAFEAGDDFLAGPMEFDAPGWPEPVSLIEPQRCTFKIEAGPVAAGSVQHVPHGWRLYRLADWQEGKRG